jgi:hypothetical protein
MSFKTSLVKTAIKWTPEMMVKWVVNIVLKDIAELSAFNFDLDTRKVYVQTTLHGEAEPIDVWLDGFAIVSDEEANYLVIQQGQSNRPWLNNIFARIAGKKWKIPVIPKYAAQIGFIIELLKAEPAEPESEQ